jgi:ectoine hydroxylase-related dioxygenase (phytanoyl-CoA dioxygenase family)
MAPSLTPQQQRAHRERGYVAPLTAMDADLAGEYRARVERYVDSVSDPLLLRTKVHLRCDALWELVHRPEIVEAVSEMLGPDVLCRASSLFVKEPGDDTFVAWHQDAAYWELDSSAVLTAWIALSESTDENGAMRVLPGSHLRPPMPQRLVGRPGNLLTRGEEITVDVDEASAVSIELEPGQMSLHDVRLAHASGENRSSHRRIGYAIRYMATHVRNTGDRRDSALLVRGVDRHGNFDPEPAPLPGGT